MVSLRTEHGRTGPGGGSSGEGGTSRTRKARMGAGGEAGGNAADQADAAFARPRPRPLRRVAAAACLVLLAMALNAVVTNDAFRWDVVAKYITADAVLSGLVTTLWLTTVAFVGGFVLGTALAVMRLSGNPILVALSWGYTWLFRSVPMLVQLLFWYNISLLYPKLSLGIPFGPAFTEFSTEQMISSLTAAVIGLVLHEAGQLAEIVRAGILSVSRDQTEAAEALGLGGWRIFRRIVLPQAMPAILPPAGSQVIGLLKGTSIVSVIAVQDLLYATQLIYNRNYLVIPLLLVATLWYLLLTTLLGVVQHFVERRYATGDRG
ncbi:amino acid ABC transporter permease [Streptomyces spinoverrucosus]|uniref:amino acid ABC transporter permease n=1 Tax=Streptomyces spinoverrucosus TaxID=284043 RepID=UPI0018C41C6B|nr:amino acid ABC transporter permease [Streptomyces spinoverrucosus]MBG0851932.1 amino acid ABC transporter permease [Streptomyces spinoverrucosus]